MNSYGQILRDLRKARSETIKCVAAQIGISYQALQSYEKEQRIPRDETKIKLARYYNVPIESIFLQINDTICDIFNLQLSREVTVL